VTAGANCVLRAQSRLNPAQAQKTYVFCGSLLRRATPHEFFSRNGQKLIGTGCGQARASVPGPPKSTVPALRTTGSNIADILDLEKQFSFYGSYHSNKNNVLIHMISVWPIFLTFMIPLAYLPALGPLPLAPGTLPLQEYMIPKLAFIQAGLAGLYYIALDKKAGFLGAFICLAGWIGANAIAGALPWSLSWKIVLASQFTCWILQLLGHGHFEGRAPALLTNLPQAVGMAPFFVLLEFLHGVGYEPTPGFRKRVEKRVDEDIREYRTSKVAKKAS
jgi:uncharacterized membrane protein YGL010W